MQTTEEHGRGTLRVSLKAVATLNLRALARELAWAFAALALASAAWPAPALGESIPYAPQGGACRATTGASAVALDARFWRTNADTIATSSGESAVIAGGLATGAGAPLAGATLCVREWAIGAGAAATDRIPLPRLGLARTGADGAFLYRVPPGPTGK